MLSSGYHALVWSVGGGGPTISVKLCTNRAGSSLVQHALSHHTAMHSVRAAHAHAPYRLLARKPCPFRAGDAWPLAPGRGTHVLYCSLAPCQLHRVWAFRGTAFPRGNARTSLGRGARSRSRSSVCSRSCVERHPRRGGGATPHRCTTVQAPSLQGWGVVTCCAFSSYHICCCRAS